jgi:hypothetical protein
MEIGSLGFPHIDVVLLYNKRGERIWKYMILQRLDNEQLVRLYQEACGLKLDPHFLKLILVEIKNRKIQFIQEQVNVDDQRAEFDKYRV